MNLHRSSIKLDYELKSLARFKIQWRRHNQRMGVESRLFNSTFPSNMNFVRPITLK
ncbi:hypothetical protein WM2015_2657 [Wenzhouxiangella marina]|uniref:Uncharacterized protein n=1 Tax=Wenzhouxiangella marina TaxID=1579979 RepID=A0A0K0XZB6_9GAMM|nr:hypothetical protein WM2015_2657 [Wenzhouxiangella marina]